MEPEHEIFRTHDGYYILREWGGPEGNRAKTLVPAGTSPAELTREAQAFFTHLRPTPAARPLGPLERLAGRFDSLWRSWRPDAPGPLLDG
jgi:hypothetical protein